MAPEKSAGFLPKEGKSFFTFFQSVLIYLLTLFLEVIENLQFLIQRDQSVQLVLQLNLFVFQEEL